MGAPTGNQNAAQGKLWNAAIRRALANRSSRSEGKEALDDLAEKLLTLAEQGDLGALKELGDRLDGKSAQSVALTGEDGGPIKVQKIERVIVDPCQPSSS